MPFLVLHGTEDSTVDLQGSIELASILKNSRLIKYEGYEHTTQMIIKKKGLQMMIDFANFIKQH